MTPVPLDQIGLRLRDHRSALWWGGLLYRRPGQVKKIIDINNISSINLVKIGLILYTHFLPYMAILLFLGRIVLFELLGLPKDQSLTSFQDILFFHFKWLGGGLVFGLGVGLVSGFTFIISYLVFFFRLYYYLCHPLFLWPNVQGHWYHSHPVSWDDLCLAPFPGLDRLLVVYTESAPQEGQQEIERLITTYPSQRQAALRAKTVLIAREAGTTMDLAKLNEIVAALPEGEKGFLHETKSLREKVHEISLLQTQYNANSRPVFRKPYAELLCARVENFQHQISGFHEPLATEFRRAGEQWLKLARRQQEEITRVLTKEPSPQVFRAGDPVDRAQEAFIPRQRVIGEVEKQIMLSSGCPGLVLYGRRRMEKSTALRNLAGLLSPSVIPVIISLQDPRAFGSLEGLVTKIQSEIRRSFPEFNPASSGSSDLAGLFDFLSHGNTYLQQEDQRLILALDEYENLDEKIGQKVLPEDLLATIRESIQTHRRITWIFAGSHEITELKFAPWTSYLISTRTIEIPAFTPAETRLLLSEPLKYSTLWPQDHPGRPRFTPEFWGEGGIDRIHAEADGWPHLVQLIAGTVIDLLNEEETSQVEAALLERALDDAVVAGHSVLYELMQRESFLPGEWEYLYRFKKSPSQPPPEDEAIRVSLLRRQLIIEEQGEWRLRVPLMERWLKKRVI
jgi:hypothetical protein